MSDTATFQEISVEVREGGIAVIAFNRADKRNAMGLAMVGEVYAALNALAARDDVRVLIFTGARDPASGKMFFVAGADIAEMRERTSEDALRRINGGLFRAIEQFHAPTIAAIEGYALGGGCELAMACDLRVAGASARFGQPEVGLGILPGAGATYRLPRLVGIGRARELIFTGKLIDAAEAYRIGLVNRVVDDGAALDAAFVLAGEIAANAALAVRMAKTAVNLGYENSTDGAMALESTMQAVLLGGPARRARMTAFLEKKAKKVN